MLERIEQAIKAGEATHSGQIRFVVEGALDGGPLFRNQPARERALDIFSQLRIWDTAHNNGVLIYLLLADRDVEIVADRGIDAQGRHGRLGENLRRHGKGIPRRAVRARRHQGHPGSLAPCWRSISRPKPGDRNELPDAPVVIVTRACDVLRAMAISV